MPVAWLPHSISAAQDMELPPKRGYPQRWAVLSSSGDNEYTVSINDSRDFGCSCPQWKFKRAECKHIQYAKDELVPRKQIREMAAAFDCFLSAASEVVAEYSSQEFARKIGSPRRMSEARRKETAAMIEYYRVTTKSSILHLPVVKFLFPGHSHYASGLFGLTPLFLAGGWIKNNMHLPNQIRLGHEIMLRGRSSSAGDMYNMLSFYLREILPNAKQIINGLASAIDEVVKDPNCKSVPFEKYLSVLPGSKKWRSRIEGEDLGDLLAALVKIYQEDFDTVNFSAKYMASYLSKDSEIGPGGVGI